MSLLAGPAHTKSNNAGQTREFKKITLFHSGRINYVPDNETTQKSIKPCPRNVGEFVPTLGPVHGACRLPAISPRLLNGSEPNFSDRQQMGWNRKRVVQTSEICRGVGLGNNDIFGRTLHTKSNMTKKG